jgi:hypothetical protein
MTETTTAGLNPKMWFDSLSEDKSWASLWNGYIICGACGGIRAVEGACGACGSPTFKCDPVMIKLANGDEVQVPQVSMGAEGRYEDWVYLRMIEHEWKRPVHDSDRFPEPSTKEGPSPRASIVILFWSYFETRIERLLRAGLCNVPERILEDALRRYSAIGARMNDFYRIAFESTYRDDLTAAGHGQIWPHIVMIQEHRNAFAHGNPSAIDDTLVRRTVELLKAEHESWIAVFNKRTARSHNNQNQVSP